MAATILSIGLLIFFGHLLAGFFERTKIPDVLVLMLAGFILGPALYFRRLREIGVRRSRVLGEDVLFCLPGSVDAVQRLAHSDSGSTVGRDSHLGAGAHSTIAGATHYYPA
jgi:hypothetical protein